MSNPRGKTRLRVLGMAFLLLLLGCASATKRLEQGTELEDQGRYSEAAARYIQALQKDPGLVEARERLARLGSEVLVQDYGDAARFRTLGKPIEAANLLRQGDALVQDAANVGVPLSLPDGWAELRRTSFDEACDLWLRLGRSAESQTRWAEALHAYEQVDAYEPRQRHVDEAGLGRVRSLVLWGEADLGGGHYRAAVQHAESALDLLASGLAMGDPHGGDLSGAHTPTWRERAQRVVDDAISLGTLHVAFPPVRAGTGSDSAMPEVFLEALNDALELDYWSQPPLFVAVIEPVVVRRELRRQGHLRDALNMREATRIGRDVGASHVVNFVVDHFTVTEQNLVRETRNVRMRSGADTTYTVVRGQKTYTLAASIVVIDVQRGREVRRRAVQASESGRFTRAQFDGDSRQLRLPDSEQRLFDPWRERDEERAIEDQLIEKASAQLANRAFDDLVSCVP